MAKNEITDHTTSLVCLINSVMGKHRKLVDSFLIRSKPPFFLAVK
jgi:hypothetical protein